MENTNMEFEVIEDAVAEGSNKRVHELNDLQLILVGGGVGEITPY